MDQLRMEVENTFAVLKNGGTILYPTDTIWGIGCDATQSDPIKKVFQIKERDTAKSFIILVADESDIIKYVAAPDPAVFDFLQHQEKPTTIIFENAIHLPDELLGAGGTVAIRLVQDPFCRQVIRRLGKPIVSTSANKSSEPAAATYLSISEDLKNQVDYIVDWRRTENVASRPSTIIRWHNDGTTTVVRP